MPLIGDTINPSNPYAVPLHTDEKPNPYSFTVLLGFITTPITPFPTSFANPLAPYAKPYAGLDGLSKFDSET